MESIREQMKNLETRIEEAEENILAQKEAIKNYKAKIKKLEKLEKEFLSIFGEIEPAGISTDVDEVVGQTVIEVAA